MNDAISEVKKSHQSYKVNLVGRRFGKWTVLTFVRTQHWLCRCDCGFEAVLRGANLSYGSTTQCQRCACTGKTKLTIEHAKAYNVWIHAKRRCFNEADQSFPNYGGRGITMCLRWKNSFQCFLADMGDPPEGFTIERIDRKSVV